MGQIELVSTVSMNFNIRMVVVWLSTILTEIFALDVFSLNFTVGVGLGKLREQNFMRMQNFDHMEIIATCTWYDFVDAA